MLAASLAADVPLFMASPDVRLGERRGVVGAVAGHGHEVAVGLLARGCRRSCPRAWPAAMKSSTPASRAMVAAVQRVVAGDHDRPDAHPAELVEPLDEARLDGVLELDEAEDAAVAADRQRRRARRRRARRSRLRMLGRQAAPSRSRRDGVDGALEDQSSPSARSDAAGAGLGAERDVLGDRSPQRPVAGVVVGAGRGAELGQALAGQLDDRASLGRLVVRPTRRGPPSSSLRAPCTPGAAVMRGRQPVAEGDRAGLVEQDHVDVAGRLDGAAAHRQHVEAGDPVHAGDADGRQQAADRRRDEAHEQGHEGHRVDGRARVLRRTAAGSTIASRKTIVRPASRIDERDLVGRALALRALDEGDHPVEERLAGIGRDRG